MEKIQYTQAERWKDLFDTMWQCWVYITEAG
jgi:hypothetical protein